MMQLTSGPNTGRYQILSIAYLVIVVVGAWWLGFFDPHGKHISPSDWGNVLAGVFSPLAFLWLLYASLSQRAELELQREELRQNNDTQNKQYEAMASQVKAMQSQSNLMRAQANATYDPIFILESAYVDATVTGINKNGEPENYVFTRLNIANVGAAVLNVKAIGPSGVAATDWNTRNNVIAFWRDGSVSWDFVDLKLSDEEVTFSIEYQRLDSIRKSNEYILCDESTRMELVEIISEIVE